MNRPHIEPRAADDAQRRAFVMDLPMLQWLVGGFVTLVGVIFFAGWWIGDQVRSHELRIASIEKTIEQRQISRDTQLAGINGRIDSLELRVRPLEVSTSSIASSLNFIRERLDSGISTLDTRLGRIEDRINREDRE